MLTHLDLFSGIGGFALAAGWAGYETVQFVEIDDFCRRVLAKHWPEVPCHDDIRTFDGTGFKGQVSLVTGGFPCQPYSVAGQRRGESDDRALWPEMRRVIAEVRPAWVLAENVPGFIPLGLDACLADLEGLGYETESFVLPACAVNAPHRRDRLWIVAHAEREQGGQRRDAHGIGRWSNKAEQTGLGGGDVPDAQDGGFRRGSAPGQSGQPAQLRQDVPDPDRAGRQEQRIAQPDETQLATAECGSEAVDDSSGRRHGVPQEQVRPGWNAPLDPGWWTTEPNVGRVATGIPARAHRLRALGNAIVPVVAYEIIRHFHDAERGESR